MTVIISSAISVLLIQIFFNTDADTLDRELSTVIPNSAPPSSKSQTLLVEIIGSNMYLTGGMVVVVVVVVTVAQSKVSELDTVQLLSTAIVEALLVASIILH